MPQAKPSAIVKSARNVAALFGLIVRDPPTLLLAGAVAAAFILFTLWFPSRHLLLFMFRSGTFSAQEKLNILTSSLGGLRTNFTAFSRWLLFATAVLSGVNIAALALLVRRRLALERVAGASLLGIIGGLVGIGCASCGSVLLTSIFGLGAVTFTAALPLKGAEFSLAGALLLALSVVMIANKAQAPLACEPKSIRPKKS